MDLLGLRGKRVFVTGASSGVGRATSIMLSQLNADVILSARRQDELEKTLSLMEQGNHKIVVCDISQFDNVVNAFKEASFDGKKLDGAIHCAGAVQLAPIRALSSDILLHMLNVNFISFAAILKCAASKRIFNPGASIVGISSSVAVYGQKGNGAYGAAKGAMNALMKTAALELAANQIRVNTICPGGIYSEMIDRNTADPSVLLGVDDVAKVLCFYMSDASSSITGTNIYFEKRL